ncbi:hypothetical protein LCGC14_1433570 [marine sediment metagenome]|uniref:N-acetyltransferase domain-containing protein n=1 Tax=marine sediment metagenome TaxID=412755 RepID=A0A0F9K928_9ZZZZ
MTDTADPLDTLTVRSLPPEEYPRILDAPGPLSELPGLPDPDHSRIIVLEDADGQIRGYWLLFNAIHAEPLYLAPEVRQRAKAGRDLLRQVYTELREAGVQTVFAVVSPEDLDTIGPMAEHLGLHPLPGTIYMGQVSTVEETEG